jgi:hypothetical protein
MQHTAQPKAVTWRERGSRAHASREFNAVTLALARSAALSGGVSRTSAVRKDALAPHYSPRSEAKWGSKDMAIPKN